MEKTVLNVAGMSCEHCVNAIEKAVGGLDGVASVAVDLSGGTVTVMHDNVKCPVAKIRHEIEEQGYESAL